MKTTHHAKDAATTATISTTSATTDSVDRNDDDDISNNDDILNIYMEFVGKETSVVSTPYDAKVEGTYDLHWMKRHRSETRILYRKGMELTTTTKTTTKAESSSSLYSSSSSTSAPAFHHEVHNIERRQETTTNKKKRKEATTPTTSNTTTSSRTRNDNDDEVYYHHVPFVLDVPSYLPYTTKYVDTSLAMSKKYRIPHQFDISYKLEAYIPFTSYSLSKDIILIEPKQTLQKQKQMPLILSNDKNENETELTTTMTTSLSSVDNHHNSQRQQQLGEIDGGGNDEDMVEFHDVIDFYICSSSKPIIRSYLCGLLNVPITTYTLVSSEEPIHFYPNQCVDVILHDPNYKLFLKPKQQEHQHQFPQDLVLTESRRNNNSNGTATSTNDTTTTISSSPTTGPSRTITVKLCEHVRWKAQTHQKVEMKTWTFTDDSSSINSCGKTKANDKFNKRGCDEVNDGVASDDGDYDDDDWKSTSNRGNNDYGKIQEKKKDENNIVITTTGSTISAYEDDAGTSTNQRRQVQINVPPDIRSTLKGKLIEISHELVVSVMTHGEHLHVSETVATSKHIPVKILNYYS